jgi:hypothetical protein
MHLKFLDSFSKSPFIEGMGRVFDFFGVIESPILPERNDAESLNKYREKDMGDFKHSIIIVEEKGHGGERGIQHKTFAA